MVQRRGSLWTLKAGWGLTIPSNLARRELERYEPMRARVLGLVNHTRAATTELFDDAEVRDGLLAK
jgi:hypothetical protein